MMTRPSTMLMLLTICTLLVSLATTVTIRPTPVFAAMPPAACAPDSGTASISGTITASGFGGLSNVIVTAYTIYGDQAGSAYTNASGVYQINNLIAGEYLIRVSGANGGYMGEWYPNTTEPSTATAVTVTDGGAVTGINVELGFGGRISGTVTAEGGGGLASIQVSIYDTDGNYAASSYTDSSGNYISNIGLASGDYRIYFQSYGAYISEYYNNKSSLDTADAVNVLSLGTVTANAALSLGGSISGKVTDGSGTPLSSIYINASGDHDSGYAYTDASGNYTISGLASGNYTLSASPFSDSTNLVGTQQTATVTAPNPTSDINFTMSPGGTISGIVTNSNGIPLNGITIYIGSNDADFGDYVSTGVDGRYSRTGLPSGTYTVHFRPSDYIPEYWDNQPESSSNRTPITVTAPATVSNINAVLAQGSSISGVVTDSSSGDPIKNVFVEILDLTGDRVETAFTQADGSYQTSSSLPSGQYLVLFNADSRFASCGYVTEYYDNKLTEETATKVTVSAPTAKTGINAQMTRGSIIFGHVTDAVTGKPITSGGVRIYDANGKQVMFGRLTFLGGYHTETALPSGSYRVQFYDYNSGYIDEFYNDKLTLATANPITLTAPASRTGIDAALSQGGLISGKVTTADTNQPFSYGYVYVWNSSGEEVGYGSLASDGSYTVEDGLATGNYLVGVVPYYAYEEGMEISSSTLAETAQTGYTLTYYRNTVIRSQATAVAVTAGNTSNGINIKMSHGSWLPLTRR